MIRLVWRNGDALLIPDGWTAWRLDHYDYRRTASGAIECRAVGSIGAWHRSFAAVRAMEAAA